VDEIQWRHCANRSASATSSVRRKSAIATLSDSCRAHLLLHRHVRA
jgi:hypothetical protein